MSFIDLACYTSYLGAVGVRGDISALKQDGVYTDKAYMDRACPDKTCPDGAYIDGAYIDRVYTDGACINKA